MDRRAQLLETTFRLVAAHGRAARTVAYGRARARLASGKEFEAAMWLEVVRLVACLTDPPTHSATWDATLTLPAPDEAYDKKAQPDVRHPVEPSNDAAIVALPVAGGVPHAATIAASDRGRPRRLGALALCGALLGAVALAATGLAVRQGAVAPSSAVEATAPLRAVDPVAPPIVATAEVQPESSRLVMTETAIPDQPKVQAALRVVKRSPVHKPPRKRVAARRQHHERSFWDRIAAVFR